MGEIWAKHLASLEIKELKMSYTVYTALNNSHTDITVAKKPFPFLNLPPEVREMIYKPLIQTGNLSILRVSRLVHKEALPYLSKHATLRISLGGLEHRRIIIPQMTGIFSPGTMTLFAPAQIQNLSIHLDIIARATPNIDTQLLRLFSSNEIPRKTCTITVEFGNLGPIRHLLVRNEFYDVVATLTGFETLTLRLEDHREEDETGILESLIATTIEPEDRPGFVMCGTNYERLFKVISRTLGPARLLNCFDGDCLRFWPREYKCSGPSRTLVASSHGRERLTHECR